MQRILIIGCPGAGKSTLAPQLSERLNLPVYHLDNAYWLPGWVGPDKNEFRQKLKEIVDRPRWIIDGCYSSTFNIRFPKADTIVHLDYSRGLCMYRTLKRIALNFGRVRPDSGAGCPEQIDFEFIKYVWEFRRTRSQMIYDWIDRIREDQEALTFTHPRQTEEWLIGLGERSAQTTDLKETSSDLVDSGESRP